MGLKDCLIFRTGEKEIVKGRLKNKEWAKVQYYLQRGLALEVIPAIIDGFQAEPDKPAVNNEDNEEKFHLFPSDIYKNLNYELNRISLT